MAFTVGRWLTLTAVIGVYAGTSLYALYLAVRAIRKRSIVWPGKRALPFLGLIAVWLGIAMALLADIQLGRRLYFSVIAYDYAVRVEFTQAISTFGVPAQNPFFFPGHEVALRYHYFWILICAVVHRMAGGWLDARQVFIAGSMWGGIGIIALIPLYLRVFSLQGAANLFRRSTIGIALLGVTGLDILGALFMVWLAQVGLVSGISPSVEWWNNQVDGWIYTMLWEPHYLCALIACLTGFLIIWDVPEDAGVGRRLVAGIAAGLAFASAAGSGLYVAMVFAAFLSLWTVVTIVKRWFRETGTLAVAGFTAIVFTRSYFHTLQSSKGSGGRLLEWTVRTFDLGEILLKVLKFDQPWQVMAGNLIMLPLNYFLELGVFFMAGYLAWRTLCRQKRSPNRQELAAFAMAGTSILICTFIRSSVISNNDLGWRGFLIAQFILLLWAADLFAQPEAISQSTKSFLHLLVILGVSGVVYDLAILRFFPVLSDAGMVPKIAWLAKDEQLGRRTYDNREAYDWLRARTSERSVIQQNPDIPGQDTFYGMYGQRQTVAADLGCGAAFGGDPDECAPILNRLAKFYSGGPAESVENVCRVLPVDVFIAKDTDPAWRDASSWVWKVPSIFQNEHVRMFACHADLRVARRDGTTPLTSAQSMAASVVSSAR